METLEKKENEEQEQSANSLSPEDLKQIKYIYANNTVFYFSNWDVRLVFAEYFPPNQLEPRVGIVLSHQQAKALSEELKANIELLESQVGEIQYKAAHPPNKKRRN